MALISTLYEAQSIPRRSKDPLTYIKECNLMGNKLVICKLDVVLELQGN